MKSRQRRIEALEDEVADLRQRLAAKEGGLASAGTRAKQLDERVAQLEGVAFVSPCHADIALNKVEQATVELTNALCSKPQ